MMLVLLFCYFLVLIMNPLVFIWHLSVLRMYLSYTLDLAVG